MPRARSGVARRRKKQRRFKQAKGNFQGRRKLWRTVQETLKRSWAFAYRDRRQRKREFRRLWITRISAACRMREMTYSRFMEGMKAASIEINRKLLSEVAIHDPAAFDALVEQAKHHVTATGKKSA